MLLGEQFRSHEESRDNKNLQDFVDVESQYSSMLNSPKETRDRDISNIQSMREGWLEIINEGTADPDNIELAKQKLQECENDLSSVLENCGYSMDEALRRGPDLFRRFMSAEDESVWQETRRLASKHGPSHRRTKQSLRDASTDQAEAAMAVGLNSYMWEVGQQLAREYGPRHGSVGYVIDMVTDEQAREAMLIALDPYIGEEVKYFATKYGPDHEYTQEALDALSSDYIRDVFISLIDEQGDRPVPADAEEGMSLQDIKDLLTKEIDDLRSANPEYTTKKIEKILQVRYHPDTYDNPNAPEIYKQVFHSLGTQKPVEK